MKQKPYFVACLLSMVIGFIPGLARAYTLNILNLDALVENSAVIVAGQLVSTNGAADVRVTRVYRGDLAENQLLVVSWIGYQKQDFLSFSPPATDGANSATGTTLILFLQWDDTGGVSHKRADGTYAWEPESTALTHWRPLIGGVRLVANGQVIDFSQSWNGSMAPRLDWLHDTNTNHSADDFRKQLESKLQTVAKTLSEIKSALAARNGNRIVDIMRGRYECHQGHWPEQSDVIIKAARDALIESHDYQALSDAIAFDNGTALDRGFLTVEGREFLLQKISDPKIDPINRRRYVRALPWAGRVGKTPVWETDPHYHARLAKIAAENSTLPELCEALLNQMADCSENTVITVLKQDINDEAAILAALYQKTSNESLKFRIEKTLHRHGPISYRQLHSEYGAVIAMVKPRQPGQFDKPVGRKFSVSLDYEPYLGLEGETPHLIPAQAILEAAGGTYDCGTTQVSGKRPIAHPLDISIQVPDEAPAGKYRLYFRFLKDGKISGQSHSVEVNL